MLTLAAYSLDLPAYACARLRLLGPASRLTGRVSLRWGAKSDGTNYAIDAQAMEGADLIVFQRYFPMEETWPLVEHALGSKVPVLYDLDDNFLAVPEGHPMRERLRPVVPYARELLARAGLVTVSSPELARAFAGLARKVEVLPNFLEEPLWSVRASREGAEANPARPVRVAYAGTPTHAEDLARVAPALISVKRRFGEGVEFVFFGCPAPRGLEAREIPFAEDYPGYARALAGLAPDIGLAPLADNPFNRCKSAVKWLEYSALGAAGIYADLPPYAPVSNGETGLKAGDEAQAWERELTRLVEDAGFRRRMGERARAEVLSGWGLSRGAEGYWRTWRRAAHGGA